MKNTIKLIAVIAFAFMTMSASAQVKLGHIETQKLIQAMPEWTAAQKQMENEQASVEKELTSLGEQFQAKMGEYTKNLSTYTDIIRAAKEQELQDLQKRIQSFQEIAQNNLEKKQQELMQPIVSKATEAIKAVGKENGFTYILDMSAGGILYASESSQDILPLVKKKLGML